MFLSVYQYFQWFSANKIIHCPARAGKERTIRLLRVLPPSLGRRSEYIPIEMETEEGIIFYFHPNTEDVPLVADVHPDFQPLLYMDDRCKLVWYTKREIERLKQREAAVS